ncbi:MAG: DNA polymerase III subunit epsilon [Betaproteobacteria bacterium]|nr:DNA polymerase III subunit epsilon [Betaproteobacteria bacterium]
MRQIVLDTETTGLDPSLGHRIVEIACVEIVNRRITERTFHQYLNPGRASDPGALEVHGLTEEFLQDKPRFAEVCDEFLHFVKDAQLVIHNAPFDLAFLNAELGRLDLRPVDALAPSVLDTLRLARDMHPGKRNSLDSLCERYGVDNSARTLHGALLDARLLAEVYLSMTRGQESLVIDTGESMSAVAHVTLDVRDLHFIVLDAVQEELAEHARYLEQLDQASKGSTLWPRAGEAEPN